MKGPERGRHRRVRRAQVEVDLVLHQHVRLVVERGHDPRVLVGGEDVVEHDVPERPRLFELARQPVQVRRPADHLVIPHACATSSR